jgi:hypothetical protein
MALPTTGIGTASSANGANRFLENHIKAFPISSLKPLPNFL